MFDLVNEYICDGCSKVRRSDEEDFNSMVCECDGFYRLMTGRYIDTNFKPYFSESHDVYVGSKSDERKLHREQGGCLGDYGKIRDRMAFVRKNREDIIHDRYAKLGLKYPKGEKTRFDEKNKRFIPFAG